MKLPTMVIIFNREMSVKLPCGIKCAFSAHAVMWLHNGISGVVRYHNEYGNFNRGEFKNNMDDVKILSSWEVSDYRKLVMTSPETIEQLFEKFKKVEVPVYMQKTSHSLVYVDFRNDNVKREYESNIPICLAVFLWKDEHKKLVKDMELM